MVGTEGFSLRFLRLVLAVGMCATWLVVATPAAHAVTYAGDWGDGLYSPLGVTTDADGNVYVADTNHHQIIKFGPDHSVLLNVGKEGQGPGQLYYPEDVAVHAGVLYVADT